MDTFNASVLPTGSPDMNATDTMPDDTRGPVFSVTWFIILLLAVSTVLTNSLILAAFYVEKKLRTYTNHFILNMTIADFTVGIFCMPIRSMIHLFDGWPFGKVASIFFMGFQNSILGVSVCGVVVVCIDRYLATFYPIQHYQRRTIRKATVVNILTWVASFGLWMMISTAWDFIDPNSLVTSSGFSRPNYSLTYTASLFMFALRFGLPFVIMTGLYIRIYFRVKNIGSRHLSKFMKKKANARKEHSITDSFCQRDDSSAVTTDDRDDLETESPATKETVAISSISVNIKYSGSSNNLGSLEIGKESDPNRHAKSMASYAPTRMPSKDGVNASKNKPVNAKKPQRESRAEGQKAMRTLTFIVIVFILTWLPTAITVTMYALTPDFYDYIKTRVRLSEITRWVAFSNSLVNPLAYAMAQPLFRLTIGKIICCRRI